MCILCTARKWCHRGAVILPWLVIPLVCVWGLSSLLLPPRFRVEVTSPRLAGILVLLATLFWYEAVVPGLTVWRARRSARLRDRRLSQAINLQRLRKTATRCCRNCLTPYRDQNPGGGGRFACVNCGHVSKRPILDLPSAGRICSQDWAAYGSRNWVDMCSAKNVVGSAYKLLFRAFLYVWWVWCRAVMLGSSADDGSSRKDGKGFSSKNGENRENSLESRIEKARRKVEEKRQARLEKEILEEEERRQREEVARLVEERRKLREEMLEAEKESLRRSVSAGKRESRKGAEKQRLESSKENDKGSSKGNSDCEELENRASKDRERKHVQDRKCESEKRLPQKTAASDRTKGPFHFSPRGFGTSASVTKANKPVNLFDDGQISGNRKDAQTAGHATGKITSNGQDRKNATNLHRSVESDVQPQPAAQKKSWLQLFTRSSAVSPCPDATTLNSNKNSQQQAQSGHITDQGMLLNYSSDNNNNNSRQSLPIGHSLMSCSVGRSLVSKLAAEHSSPFFKGSRQDIIMDEADIFDDPCYVPDPISLLGPVSESLDNFPLDLGFVGNDNTEEPLLRKNVFTPADVIKPSPTEFPLSRPSVSGEKYFISRHSKKLDETSNAHELSTWQMWDSPVAQDGPGLVGRANWFSHLGQNKSSQEDVMPSLLHQPLGSHLAKENNFHSGTHAPQKICTANYLTGGVCSTFGQLPDNNVLWAQRTQFHPLPTDGDNHSFPPNQMDLLALNDVIADDPKESASSQSSGSSPVDRWSK